MNYKGSEKRRFVRARFPCKIVIQTPREQVIKTHTENIGAGGVRVIIDTKLIISSTVGLQIYLGDEAISCEGRVVWAVDNQGPAASEPLKVDTGIEFYKIDEESQRVTRNFVDAVVASG